ncbi:MAG: ABC transporter permease [Acidimicrobiales bacterium]|jgi:peptide/nickel transport system permease protein
MTFTNLPVPEGPVEGPEGGDVESEGSAFRLFVRTFSENKLAVAGLVTLVVIAGFSWLGPVLYHSNQSTPTLILPNGLKGPNAAPGPGHPLGMDNSGFDVLGRLMIGGRISLEIGFIAGLAGTVIGVTYGAVSGYFGKWLDMLLMRIVDVGLAFPIIFLFVYISSVVKPSESLLILLLAVVTWLGPARLVRGETLSLKTREYVQALRTMGGGAVRSIGRHIVPNTIGTIVVTITFQIADAIIVLSTLQFLGFGLPPTDPTWGSMLNNAINNASAQVNGYWWQIYPAGLMIILTVVAINLIGDALRDSFEVRLQKR